MASEKRMKGHVPQIFWWVLQHGSTNVIEPFQGEFAFALEHHSTNMEVDDRISGGLTAFRGAGEVP